MRALLLFVSAIIFSVLAGIAVADLHHDTLTKQKLSAAFSDNNNLDVLKAINTITCASSTNNKKYCIDPDTDNNHWPELKEKLIRGILQFAHDMVNPREVMHLVIRKRLPQEVQDLFASAKKHFSAAAAAQSSSSSSEAEQLKRAAHAVMAAVDERRDGKAIVGLDKYAIFGFLPQFSGDAHIGSTTGATFDTHCFGDVKVTAVQEADDKVKVTTQGKHNGLLCSDWVVLLAGAKDMHFQFILNDNPSEWTFDTSSYTAENKWYLQRHGIRVLRFPKGLIDTIGQILATAEMIAGFAEFPLTNITIARNLEFLNNYVELSPRMHPKTTWRTGGDSVGLSPEIKHMIQSGDGIIVARADGLDPMLGWADGATSGHSTMAMRDKNGKLHICESTTKDAYWPVGNGVECHDYDEWIVAVERAQMAALWNPLSPEYRAKFNVEKGWAYINQHLGVNYGFPNMLFAWIDLPKDNFPCLPQPGNFSLCFDPQTVEFVIFILDRIMGNANTNIFRQAFNHRTGTKDLPVLTAFMGAVNAGKAKDLSDLWILAEQDSWLYNMTLNNGTTAMTASSVCDVLVCKVWKAGGMFNEINNNFNCGEMDIWGQWSLKIFNEAQLGNNRPEICKKTDPANHHCQLTGIFTLHFKPDPNSRLPYPHMNEKCPSKCPNYVRPAGC